MRIRGGCAILWREQGVSQIGTSPDRRTIVSDLSLAEQRLLDELGRNLEVGGVYRAARRSRVPVTRARQIVEELEHQGALVSSATSELGGADGVYWDRLGVDAKDRSAGQHGSASFSHRFRQVEHRPSPPSTGPIRTPASPTTTGRWMTSS